MGRQGHHLVSPDPRQLAYEAHRKAHRTAFEALAAEGAFRAPEHLVPGLQGSLGLAGALELDAQRAEAG